MYPDPHSVTRVTSIGAGPIGAGWTAHFLARGYDVTAYLHDVAETDAFMSILNTAWISLTDLGLVEGGFGHDSSCHFDAGMHGIGRVKNRPFVFLQVAIVSEWQALDQHE